MQTSAAVVRLACLAFGAGVGLIFSNRLCSRLGRACHGGGAVLLVTAINVGKTVGACLVGAAVAPVPAAVSILYTGLGVLAAHTLTGTEGQAPGLSIVCPWLILYLPFTGALACLGGGLLALAADAHAMAGLAMVVLAAPMALLQFGAEGGLLVLLGAALLCPKGIGAVLRDVRESKR